MFEAFLWWLVRWLVVIFAGGFVIGCGVTSCVEWLGGMR